MKMIYSPIVLFAFGLAISQPNQNNGFNDVSFNSLIANATQLQDPNVLGFWVLDTIDTTNNPIHVILTHVIEQTYFNSDGSYETRSATSANYPIVDSVYTQIDGSWTANGSQLIVQPSETVSLTSFTGTKVFDSTKSIDTLSYTYLNSGYTMAKEISCTDTVCDTSIFTKTGQNPDFTLAALSATSILFKKTLVQPKLYYKNDAPIFIYNNWLFDLNGIRTKIGSASNN